MKSYTPLNYSTKWLNHFERHANAARDSCKDPTGVGACLIGEDKEILLTAFNGPAIGVTDKLERRFTRPLKYDFASHSERNLMNFAARNGIRTKGLTVYATHHPCPDCANALVQSGIRCVIIGGGTYKSGTPDKLANADSILREAGVQIINHKTSLTMQRADAFCRSTAMHREDRQGIPFYYTARRIANRIQTIGLPDYFAAVPLLYFGVRSNHLQQYVPSLPRFFNSMGFDETTAEIVNALIYAEEKYPTDPIGEAQYLIVNQVPASFIAYLINEDVIHPNRWFGVTEDRPQEWIDREKVVTELYRTQLHSPAMHKFLNSYGASPYNMNSSVSE